MQGKEWDKHIIARGAIAGYEKSSGAVTIRNDKIIDNLLFHYTSMSSLFNILNSDMLWLGSSRNSNDDTESKLIPDGQDGMDRNNTDDHDDFILCVCPDGNKLSQWRGYCPEGGASIGFLLNIVKYQNSENDPSVFAVDKTTFSVLYSNYNSSKQYVKYENVGIPVVYVKPPEQNIFAFNDIQKLLNSKNSSSLMEMRSFFKHKDFHEEAEYRIAFSNYDKRLKKCIAFRLMRDKQIVPYIAVRFGDAMKDKSMCGISTCKIKKNIQRSGGDTIYRIPQGNNQEELFDIANTILQGYSDESDKPYLICEGHLPIKKIIISPAHNQKILKKQVSDFCKTKYWLQNVTVECSETPYIPPIE
ncbi:MAG: DUF2971 domain-containing protein [Dysgonamonadaceae bacterium]|jgi:hypothetical protein|nr:DUF2971 domain-containing protein [Dysgonamonadaceae bacterium]